MTFQGRTQEQCEFEDPRNQGLLDTLVSSLEITSKDDIGRWLDRDVSGVMPHAMFLCGMGIRVTNGWRADFLYHTRLPHGYLTSIKTSSGLFSTPLLEAWWSTREPQLFEPRLYNLYQNLPWFKSFKFYKCQNAVCHGQSGFDGQRASFFCFYGLGDFDQQLVRQQVRIISPFIHRAIGTCIATSLGDSQHMDELSSRFELTKREIEVLRLLVTGKSNAEISRILGTCLSTVKNQVCTILKKLDKRRRTEVIAAVLNNAQSWIR